KQHRHRRLVDARRRLSGDALRLWLFALSDPRFEGLAVLHSVHAVLAAPRGGGAGPDHVPALRAREHAPRPDLALYELQSLARGLADEGIHRRDPAGVRRG